MIDKNDLLKMLKNIDKKLGKEITIVAVGGTAMTLLGLKTSTMDVDFCLKREDLKQFEKLTKNSEIKIDIFTDGYIFSEQLPQDYIDKAKDYKTKFKNIKLKILDLIDIIITKAARYSAKDEEDIATLAKQNINKEDLIKRFNKVKQTYAGSEKDFEHNFNVILNRYYNN